MAVFIFTVDMLHFLFCFDEKSRVYMHYAAMRQSIKIPFRGGGGSLRSISPI